jgi:hypothetical protein
LYGGVPPGCGAAADDKPRDAAHHSAALARPSRPPPEQKAERIIRLVSESNWAPEKAAGRAMI